MARRCPNCKSFNVRHASIRAAGAFVGPRLRSPYRCRDCTEKFWVIRRKTYQYAAIALAVNVPFFALIAGFIFFMTD